MTVRRHSIVRPGSIALALSQWGEVRGAISLYNAFGAGWQEVSLAQQNRKSRSV
ncbi:hypothetical protein ABER23_33845 [Paenibacillus lautus]|uniref:hypothetical protein n=1 Tax=Paenibacillus lautus TaxID=1401 RepID=UPI003D2D31C1